MMTTHHRSITDTAEMKPVTLAESALPGESSVSNVSNVTVNWHDPASWSVLVVDDEADNLELVADTLDFYGSEVRVAHNGEAGLALLATWQPSFILLDLSMPKMDGWKMHAELREMPHLANTPVIALTAHAMAGDRERALSAGFDGYMTKPIEIPTFVADIAKAVQAKDQLKMMDWNALVIEDEEDSMELVRGILQYHGVKTVGAHDGEQALRLLEGFTPDLLIVDLALPGIDGWTLLQQIKQNPRLANIPRVAVTAYHNPMLARTAIDAGFNAYFAKPIDATSFVRELQGIVRPH